MRRMSLFWVSSVDAIVDFTDVPAGTEVWEVRNFTRHVHPVHLHQVQFELLGRGHSGRSRPGPADRGGWTRCSRTPGRCPGPRRGSTCRVGTPGTATCWSTRTTR
ncbi:multicopper oxidase domain-containing protein [Micromonospora parva]